MSTQKRTSRPSQPLTVIMEDDIIHTVDYPCCNDPDCICHDLEMQQAKADQPAPRPRGKTPFISSPPTGIDAPLNAIVHFAC